MCTMLELVAAVETLPDSTAILPRPHSCGRIRETRDQQMWWSECRLVAVAGLWLVSLEGKTRRVERLVLEVATGTNGRPTQPSVAAHTSTQSLSSWSTGTEDAEANCFRAVSSDVQSCARR